MSTAMTKPPSHRTAPRAGATATTTAAGRMRSLARAELTLLVRSKGTLFAAAVVPLILPFSIRSATDSMDLEGTGLSLGTILLPASVGFSLLFAVYIALTTIYVTRREELVLKRLRVGELRDTEILAGAALPSLCIAVAQIVLLVTGCMIILDVGPPKAPHLALAGVVLGLVLSASLAAVTAAFSRSAESAQVTSMPVVLVSMLASGITVPLEVLPDRLAQICEMLPLTGVISLVRGGWTGTMSGADTLAALATAVAWTLLAVFAVRRWFRWEPRH